LSYQTLELTFVCTLESENEIKEADYYKGDVYFKEYSNNGETHKSYLIYNIETKETRNIDSEIISKDIFKNYPSEKYESERYHTQRNFAFSNWNTTDPFEYPENITDYFMKCASVDVEHIKTTENVVAGQFASYHVYPYYPDYLNYVSDVDWAALEIGDKSLYAMEDGKTNTYRAYLQTLNNHHKMPVVISEFGVSTGRGMAQEDANTDRNQGNMSEKEQGEAIIDR
jgi:hypothetical protein